MHVVPALYLFSSASSVLSPPTQTTGQTELPSREERERERGRGAIFPQIYLGIAICGVAALTNRRPASSLRKELGQVGLPELDNSIFKVLTAVIDLASPNGSPGNPSRSPRRLTYGLIREGTGKKGRKEPRLADFIGARSPNHVGFRAFV